MGDGRDKGGVGSEKLKTKNKKLNYRIGGIEINIFDFQFSIKHCFYGKD